MSGSTVIETDAAATDQASPSSARKVKAVVPFQSGSGTKVSWFAAICAAVTSVGPVSASVPRKSVPLAGSVSIRKFSHVAEYGLLTLLILRAFWIGAIRSVATSLGLTCLLVGTLALADEARQAYSPERTGSGWDVGLDLGGAALIASVMLLLQAIQGRPLFSRDRDRDRG